MITSLEMKAKWERTTTQSPSMMEGSVRMQFTIVVNAFLWKLLQKDPRSISFNISYFFSWSFSVQRKHSRHSYKYSHRRHYFSFNLQLSSYRRRLRHPSSLLWFILLCLCSLIHKHREVHSLYVSDWKVVMWWLIHNGCSFSKIFWLRVEDLFSFGYFFLGTIGEGFYIVHFGISKL